MHAPELASLTKPLHDEKVALCLDFFVINGVLSMFISRPLVLLTLALPTFALAKTTDQAYVELQGLRYTTTSSGYELKNKDGQTKSFTMSASRFRTFNPWVSFVARGETLALQLTRSFSTDVSGYLSAGFVFSENLEAGLGVNISNENIEEIETTEQKTKSSSTLYFVGPYFRFVTPLDFANLEVRGEFDYGTISQEVTPEGGQAIKVANVKGFEGDLDVRLVYEVTNHVAMGSGVSVFYQSLRDSAPRDTRYAEKARKDLTLGLNLMNVRFKF